MAGWEAEKVALRKLLKVEPLKRYDPKVRCSARLGNCLWREARSRIETAG